MQSGRSPSRVENMFSSYDTHPEDNLFVDFKYEKWADPALIQIHEVYNYENALTEIENSPTLEASFAICWHQLDYRFYYALGGINIKEAFIKILEEHEDQISAETRSRATEEFHKATRRKQDDFLNRLSDMVILLKPNASPDGYVSDVDAMMFVHLSVGLALLMEDIEKARTERFWELVQDAIRVIKLPKTQGLVP